MRKIAWLLLCCFTCVFWGSCTKDEGSEETATQKESTEVAEEVAIVGRWQITEWKADHVDQIEMSPDEKAALVLGIVGETSAEEAAEKYLST